MNDLLGLGLGLRLGLGLGFDGQQAAVEQLLQCAHLADGEHEADARVGGHGAWIGLGLGLGSGSG